MSGWDASVVNLTPKYGESDNRGRGRRMTLRTISVSTRVDKRGRNSGTRYELTFRVEDDGTVRLGKIERPHDHQGVHLHTFSLGLAEAEAAVGSWVEHEDSENLWLKPTAGYLLDRDDADAAPITNEAAASSDE